MKKQLINYRHFRGKNGFPMCGNIEVGNRVNVTTTDPGEVDCPRCQRLVRRTPKANKTAVGRTGELAMVESNVMLNMLSGENSGADVLINGMGKIITALELELNDDDGDALRLEFSDGSKIKLRDDGQSCCEHRYMQTDDNLEDYIGAKLLGVEIKEAPDILDDADEKHEVQFLEIKTDRGVLTMANHNTHNGWYSGFWIIAEAV